MRAPHDAFFRAAFRSPRRARELARVSLPNRVLRHLNLGSLHVMPGSGVDPRLRAWHTDLLLRTSTTSGRPALVYLLFEHKSSLDPRTPFQLLRYMCRVWDTWTSRRENLGWTRLPPIIPVVLSQGRTPWRRSLEFSHLVEWPGGPDARAPTPRFSPILLDLARKSDKELGNDPAVRLLLRLMKHVQAKSLQPLRPVLRDLGRLAPRDERELFGPVVQYVLQARQGPLSKGILEALPPERRRKAMTIAESLERKGRLEGKLEGEIHAKRETLERLSDRKFGLTPAERRAIRTADSAKMLDAALDAVVTARSKAAVLLHLGGAGSEPRKSRRTPRRRASGSRRR